MLFYILLFLILIVASYFYSRRQVEGRPPIVYGALPYIGALEYLDLYKLKECAKKYGKIFSLYIFGNYYTIVSNEEDIKTYSTEKESDLSFSKFYEIITKRFNVSHRDISLSDYQKNVKFIQKFATTKENMLYYLQKQKKVTMNTIKKWKDMKQIDLYEESLKFICYLNIEQFVGTSTEELVDHMLETDIAMVLEKRLLSSYIRNQIGLETVEKRSYNYFKKFILKQIEEREKAKDKIPFDDVIEYSKEYENVSVEDLATGVIHSIIFAAQINTTLLLFWSIFRIYESKEDELLEVKNELRNAPKDFGLDYLDSMKSTDIYLYEILRIYYNAIPGGRKLLKDYEFQGYKLKKGETISHLNISKGAFENYDNEFEKIDLNPKKRESPYIFTPFGAGRHPCIGKFFAQNEVKTILVVLYQNVNIKLNTKKNFKDMLKEVDWVRPKEYVPFDIFSV